MIMFIVYLEPDKLQFGDVILNVDAVRVTVVKNHSPKHVHVKFKVIPSITQNDCTIEVYYFDYTNAF